MNIKCTDCYEDNHIQNQRCSRCGRLLDDARGKVTKDHFEWQHHDAPNTIVRRDNKGNVQKKVW